MYVTGPADTGILASNTLLNSIRNSASAVVARAFSSDSQIDGHNSREMRVFTDIHATHLEGNGCK